MTTTTAYCETEEEAVEFVSQLGKQLAKYKLTLNINKTEYLPLPRALEDNWVSDLAIALPKGDRVSSYDAIGYLDFLELGTRKCLDAVELGTRLTVVS